MLKYIVFSIALLFFYSCQKDEGVGGLATIKGKLKLQGLNCQLNNVGESTPAMDKDIFIQYGDNVYVDDKIESSPSGDFQFNYLTPGSYKIYVYSDDPQSFKADQKVVIEKTVTIDSKKQTVDLGEITIYKHLDIDDGEALVTGVVKRFQYANGTTIIIDTIAAQDFDVYLLLEGSTSCFIKEKTLYDGSFAFNNVIPGNYRFYVLSEQAFTKEDIPVFVDFSIDNSSSDKDLGTIYISDF